jgi:hypothetical protein
VPWFGIAFRQSGGRRGSELFPYTLTGFGEQDLGHVLRESTKLGELALAGIDEI